MLVFFVAFATLAVTGCATRGQSTDAHIRSLEKKLRLARGKIETLRERNLVLGQKVRMLETDVVSEPAPLEAFAEPASKSERASTPAKDLIDVAKPARETASDYIDLRAKRPAATGDRVLAQAALQQFKNGDHAEANRTLLLLQKSFPDSKYIETVRRTVASTRNSRTE